MLPSGSAMAGTKATKPLNRSWSWAGSRLSFLGLPK
ncbi:MAG: hypothetical protein BWX48_00942 [Verrucomicrobia bacterium ADurb.Bin006]|nr:MAG: hypothetical protein BWX48_00942 [Verrucomicrobia bacterium ADurb.Bin006]